MVEQVYENKIWLISDLGVAGLLLIHSDSTAVTHQMPQPAAKGEGSAQGTLF